MSLVSVVCCDVGVAASGGSLVQRGPTECGVSECDREASIMTLRPTGGRLRHGKEKKLKKQSSCSDATSNPPATYFNPLNAELNPICHLLALLGVHHFLHVSRIRVNPITALNYLLVT